MSMPVQWVITSLHERDLCLCQFNYRVGGREVVRENSIRNSKVTANVWEKTNKWRRG